MKYAVTLILACFLSVPAFAQPKDLHTTLQPVFGFAPVVATNDTAITTAIIDSSLYNGLEFVIITGTLADTNATFAVTLAHGDAIDATGTTITDSTGVSADDLIGTTATVSFTFAADNSIKRIGYVGDKKYVKLTLTPSGNTGNTPVACIVVGRPRVIPWD